MTAILVFIFMFSDISLKKPVSIPMEGNYLIPAKDFS